MKRLAHRTALPVRRAAALGSLAVLVGVLAACGSKSSDQPKPPEPTLKDGAPVVALGDAGLPTLPPAPPLPEVPAGLPPVPKIAATPELVALGELLFSDPRLSSTGTLSCASCHDPAHGFAGADRVNTAAEKRNARRAPTLVNLAWQTAYGWDGRADSIEDLLATHLGGQLDAKLPDVIARLAEDPVIQAHFARVGGEQIVPALVAYTLTRYEGAAPWDRYEREHDKPPELVVGYGLFMTKAQCSVCHTPPLYTDGAYHALGLISVPDQGRGMVEAGKDGQFKTPSLRGAAKRQGFFHDGSAETLDAAIDWHLQGGRGAGADPSIIDPALRPVTLTAAERTALGAFVAALTAK